MTCQIMITKNLVTLTILMIAMLIQARGYAACFEEAAARYRVPVALLKAISRVESGGRPNAINRNTNGSYDIGHMQINSRWLPTLQRYGITQQALFDACTNTYVGAWVLAQNISRFGYSWEAVGAYNVGCSSLKGYDCYRARSTYAWKVYRAMGSRS